MRDGTEEPWLLGKSSAVSSCYSSSSSSGGAGSSKRVMCVDDFECAICFELLLDPVVAPCGHDTCLQCYQRWVHSCSAASAAVCPLCRCPLPTNLAVCVRLKKAIERLCHKDLKRRRNERIAESKQEPPTNRYPPPSPAPLGVPFDYFAAWSAAQQTLMSAMMLAAHASMVQLQPLDPSLSLWNPTSDPNREPSAHHHDAPTVVSSAHCFPCSIPPAAAMSSASDISRVDGGAMQQAATARRPWQLDTDSTERLAMAQSILRVLQARGLHSSLGPKLPDTVRLLELMLYRAASSKAAYLDPSDIEQRIAMTVRQRTSAARARRLHRSSPPDPGLPASSANSESHHLL